MTSCLTGRTRALWQGVFWSGSEQRIIGYGDVVQVRPRGDDVSWFLVGLARQQRYYSLYVNTVEDGAYLIARYADRLGKVTVGSASLRFGDIGGVDVTALHELLSTAHELTPPDVISAQEDTR